MLIYYLNHFYPVPRICWIVCALDLPTGDFGFGIISSFVNYDFFWHIWQSNLVIDLKLGLTTTCISEWSTLVQSCMVDRANCCKKVYKLHDSQDGSRFHFSFSEYTIAFLCHMVDNIRFVLIFSPNISKLKSCEWEFWFYTDCQL